jgi:hypothetical protein
MVLLLIERDKNNLILFEDILNIDIHHINQRQNSSDDIIV